MMNPYNPFSFSSPPLLCSDFPPSHLRWTNQSLSRTRRNIRPSLFAPLSDLKPQLMTSSLRPFVLTHPWQNLGSRALSIVNVARTAARGDTAVLFTPWNEQIQSSRARTEGDVRPYRRRPSTSHIRRTYKVSVAPARFDRFRLTLSPHPVCIAFTIAQHHPCSGLSSATTQINKTCTVIILTPPAMLIQVDLTDSPSPLSPIALPPNSKGAPDRHILFLMHRRLRARRSS
ncbi:hypothetical protein F5148DRAFT_440578 [Russula earlei]|uniref:Uncharacterized protein n=1 Tax=Russula earlei TaxID=71964 RepID=A0ACC0UIC0_9AGAM|nr:hypothetical protein F5148DRAFT_440578 [Russula earlei]